MLLKISCLCVGTHRCIPPEAFFFFSPHTPPWMLSSDLCKYENATRICIRKFIYSSSSYTPLPLFFLDVNKREWKRAAFAYNKIQYFMRWCLEQWASEMEENKSNAYISHLKNISSGCYEASCSKINFESALLWGFSCWGVMFLTFIAALEVGFIIQEWYTQTRIKQIIFQIISHNELPNNSPIQSWDYFPQPLLL